MADASQSNRSRRVELILQQIEALPTLGPIATRILTVASEDDADIREIIGLIETDPALTSRILGLCRRAEHGLGNSVSTVGRAVVLLGLEAVQSAVLSVHIYEFMRSRTRREFDDGGEHEASAGFDHAGFWKHSVGTACAAELIAGAHPALGVKPGEAFVAGLLHDLGKLVLELVLPQSYVRVVALAERRQCNTAELERQIIGLDHHTAGKRVAEHWTLPHMLQDVCWLHGQSYATLPELAHKPAIGMVTVARALCREQHLGWSGDCGPAPALAGLCDEAGLNPDVVAGLVGRLHEEVAARCGLLGLENEATPELLLESIGNANRRLSRMNTVLEARSRASHQQARVLAAISAFHARALPGRSVVDALGDMVRSASDMFGPGFYAVLYQTREDEPWQVCQYSTEGSLLRSQIVDPPSGEGAHVGSLARLTDPSQLSVATIGLLPFVADFLNDAADMRSVRLLPLTTGSEFEYPAAVLLHDRDPSESALNQQQLHALTSTWASAISGAARHEGARRLGEQLAESNRFLAEAQNKLAATQAAVRLGEVAAGAAHEMNNPLTIISGRSQMLAGRLTEARDREAARAISEAAEKLSDLITGLHLLSDPPKARRRSTSMGDVLLDAAERAKRQTGSDLMVKVDLPGDLPIAWVDRELLTRAVLEVIANALQASSDRNVHVTVQIDPLDDRLVIVVTDQGTGMPEATLQHAFDPFFSDKPAGRRTGMGLARARVMVELHEGEVSLQSTPGAGTVARIALPCWRADTRAGGMEAA
jgi:signal transduction histidine kinase/HD-like signal output (HDOD) protein